MNKAGKSWQLLVLVLLSGCMPLNVNHYNTSHVTNHTTTVTLIEEKGVGVFCENKAVMRVATYEVPDKVDVDKAKDDEEVVQLLLDHIELLRKDLKELSEVDYRCEILR